MSNSEQESLRSLSIYELKATSGGAVWAIPAAKTIFKIAGGVLAAAAAYDGAHEFMDGYQACR